MRQPMRPLRYAFASLLLATSANAYAQGFPSKPIKVIVPYSAGGVVDVIARAVGDRMTQTWASPA